MYSTSCTTWTVRVKIIIWERSCLEARVSDTSNFDFKSAKYLYDMLFRPVARGVRSNPPRKCPLAGMLKVD